MFFSLYCDRCLTRQLWRGEVIFLTQFRGFSPLWQERHRGGSHLGCSGGRRVRLLAHLLTDQEVELKQEVGQKYFLIASHPVTQFH